MQRKRLEDMNLLDDFLFNAPMPHHLPANHKETQPLQPSSAALMAHPLPSDHHALTPPKKQNGQTASGTAAWSGPGASE